MEGGSQCGRKGGEEEWEEERYRKLSTDNDRLVEEGE